MPQPVDGAFPGPSVDGAFPDPSAYWELFWFAPVKNPDQRDGVVLRFSPREIDATTLASHIMRELKSAPFVEVELDRVQLRLSQDR